MWIGAGLVGAGTFAVPLTALGSTSGRNEPRLLGVGLMGAGSAFMWLGAQDRRKGMQPSTTFGVTTRRVRSVQIRRSW